VRGAWNVQALLRDPFAGVIEERVGFLAEEFFDIGNGYHAGEGEKWPNPTIDKYLIYYKFYYIMPVTFRFFL
jgi:hypothetical protein